MRTLFCMGVILGAGLLSACSQPNTQNTPTSPKTAAMSCHDAYLKTYHCSLKQVQHAAKSGDPDAQYALGYMYFYGIDTTRNINHAEQWIADAAKQGQPLAKDAIRQLKKLGYFTKHFAIAKTHHVARSHHKRSALPIRQANLMKTPKQDYTVQVIADHQLKVINDFVKKNKLTHKVRYYTTHFQHKKWYVVLYGDYKTNKAAQTALAKLPATTRSRGAWVKPMRNVQKEIRTQHTI